MPGTNTLRAVMLAAIFATVAGCAATPRTAAERPARLASGAKTDVQSCDMVTGSRIRPRPEDHCKSDMLPARTYTQEELEQTGQINLAEALRMIDPIFL